MLNISDHPTLAKSRRASPPTNPELPPLNNTQQIEALRMEAWLGERINDPARRVEIVTLTPVLARLLLARNKENRPISEVNLDRIKRDVKSGRFPFNGEAIIVSKSGELNDGQHRCRAVAETGKSIETVIVFGPDRTSRMTLNQGTVRTCGHYLSMQGHTDANGLAATAGFFWQLKTWGRLSSAGSERPTKTEITEVVEHYQDLPDSLRFCSRMGVGAICTRSLMAFCHYAIKSKAGVQAVDEFFNRLIDGNGLEKDNAILYCRNRLIVMRGTRRVGDKAELIFRAWNIWRRGEPASRIPVVGGKLPKLEG